MPHTPCPYMSLVFFNLEYFLNISVFIDLDIFEKYRLVILNVPQIGFVFWFFMIRLRLHTSGRSNTEVMCPQFVISVGTEY